MLCVRFVISTFNFYSQYLRSPTSRRPHYVLHPSLHQSVRLSCAAHNSITKISGKFKIDTKVAHIMSHLVTHGTDLRSHDQRTRPHNVQNFRQ